MNWLIVVASGFFGGLVSILLRVAALKGITLGEASILPWIARGTAIGAYGVGFLLYTIALRKTTLGVAYPTMVAISILVVLSFTALHEHVLRPIQMVGAVVILIGVWMVTRYA
ncbi:MULTISPECIES: small multidrug resistance protein [unclassified Burkholderia]|uniref:small multidrug resistance protein n=1 Tax=unclassified Burkholderia TaxID=2613784 RepID=UPI000F5922DA|nr:MULTISPECIES: small multidrug resistance protein [unclassified Burkholderia]RQR76605.1 small multidrug resistance protein [Burkholderia sp. Bp9012]RQZ59926.1 small multidrug resistance protein [Burkholderia sp. Bp9004]